MLRAGWAATAWGAATFPLQCGPGRKETPVATLEYSSALVTTGQMYPGDPSSGMLGVLLDLHTEHKCSGGPVLCVTHKPGIYTQDIERDGEAAQ